MPSAGSKPNPANPSQSHLCSRHTPCAVRRVETEPCEPLAIARTKVAVESYQEAKVMATNGKRLAHGDRGRQSRRTSPDPRKIDLGTARK